MERTREKLRTVPVALPAGGGLVIGLIKSLLIAASLLVLLLLAARRKSAPSAEGSGQAVIDARGALDRLKLGLLPPELVGAPAASRRVSMRDRGLRTGGSPAAALARADSRSSR